MPKFLYQYALFSCASGYEGYTFVGRLTKSEYNRLHGKQKYTDFKLFTAYSHGSDLASPEELRWTIDNFDKVRYNPSKRLFEIDLSNALYLLNRM
jgi:hypothetical protein